jgi:hypothetical protein
MSATSGRKSAASGLKFSRKTLKLVDESLAIWESKLGRSDLINISMGCFACPLCMAFRDIFNGETPCVGCPVADITGRNCCKGTPYHAAGKALERASALSLNIDARAEELLKWHKAARREIAFLKKVRTFVVDNMKRNNLVEMEYSYRMMTVMVSVDVRVETKVSDDPVDAERLLKTAKAVAAKLAVEGGSSVVGAGYRVRVLSRKKS